MPEQANTPTPNPPPVTQITTNAFDPNAQIQWVGVDPARREPGALRNEAQLRVLQQQQNELRRQLVENYVQNQMTPALTPAPHDAGLNPTERFVQFVRIVAEGARRYGILNDLNIPEAQFQGWFAETLRYYEAHLWETPDLQPPRLRAGWVNRNRMTEGVTQVPRAANPVNRAEDWETLMPPTRPTVATGTGGITLPPLTPEQRASAQAAIEFAQPPPPPE